jgi:hypothetical protein
MLARTALSESICGRQAEVFVKNFRSPILYADLPTSSGKSSNALSRFTGHNRSQPRLKGLQCAGAQRECTVSARGREGVSMEDSPWQINLVFSVLIKAILDPAT